jgi:hypothetical protein
MTELDEALAALGSLRTELHACGAERRDALFELGDALVTGGAVSSLAHLSTEALHRRGWGSAYAALRRGRMDEEALRDALARRPLVGGAAVYAVDVSVWPRCDAECSPERGFYYHPSRHSAGQPIVAGWAYSWLAELGFARGSWTAPVDVRRVRPHENANAVAAEHVGALLGRRPPDAAAPLFVFDAGYDPVQLALGLGDAPATLLVRLRSDRCFYADVPPQPGRNGRPRRHGRQLACYDEATWWEPDGDATVDDAQYGAVRVRAWSGVHAKTQAHPGRGTKGPRPIVPGTLLLVEVGKLPRPTRPPKRLWLWWSGPRAVDLDLAWRAYVRRFDLEHTLRFCKQTLGWTTPRVRHPAQADRWTWLVVAAYTQLRLARAVAADRRLPWERPLAPGRLTPCRVRRAFPALLCALGSPAAAPKPTGRSPGRPKGKRSGSAIRWQAVKKAA